MIQTLINFNFYSSFISSLVINLILSNTPLDHQVKNFLLFPLSLRRTAQQSLSSPWSWATVMWLPRNSDIIDFELLALDHPAKLAQD